MSRDGSGVYSPPAGTTATSGTTIESAKYNAYVADITADLNAARPVVAGGTGSTTASAARTALSAQTQGDVLDDLNTLGANAADGEFLVGTGAGALAWEKLATAITSLGLHKGSFYSTYGGTANAITLTTGLSLSALTTGQEFRFRATSANTGATTINVDSIGALTAKTVTGAALPSGYIRTDVDTVCRYDGTDVIVSRVVEKGSEANGDWTKWEDGTMICRHKLSATFSSATATTTDEQTWTFPEAFSSAPIVIRSQNNSVNGTGDQDFNRGYVRAAGTSSVVIRYTWGVNYGSSGTWNIYAHATGNWYE